VEQRGDVDHGLVVKVHRGARFPVLKAQQLRESPLRSVNIVTEKTPGHHPTRDWEVYGDARNGVKRR
jgi:hypothetical protein